MAAQSGIEEAGQDSFAQRQSEMLSEGFSFSGYERDSLYLNLGNKKFLNISGISGVDDVGDGRSAVFADFDNDGDHDIFLASIQGKAHQLFRNNVGQDHAWLRVSLLGKESGPDAFGAVVRVKTEAGILTKIKAGGSGYLAQHDPRLIFGLNGATTVAWLEVSWPSGVKQRFENVQARTSILIRENNREVSLLSEASFALPDPLSKEELQLAGIKLKKGQPLPDVSFTNSDGLAVTMTEILGKGQRAIVNLWATWCAPCAREMPQLQKLAEQHTTRIIGLSMDDPQIRAKVFGLLKRKGFNYPNYLRLADTPEAFFNDDKISVPLTLLVNEKGLIEDIILGWSEKIPQFAAGQ